MEDTPKTISSRRDIPLTEDTIRLLEAQRKYWGFKVEKMDRYFFCNEDGEPLSRERVQGEIDRIIRRIRAAGMPPQVLKTFLGHSSLAMTMDLYSHVLPDSKAEEVERRA